MEKINPKRALAMGAVAIAWGFHTVMQIGDQPPVFQNDGKAFIGGVMIVLGGFLVGAALMLRKLGRKDAGNGRH
jgi:hypothetical protein